MNHAVSHCLNFVERLDAAVFLTEQYAENIFNPRTMFQYFPFEHHLLPIGQGEFEERTFHSDFFNAPLSDNLFAFHFEKLVFDRRASAI